MKPAAPSANGATCLLLERVPRHQAKPAHLPLLTGLCWLSDSVASIQPVETQVRKWGGTQQGTTHLPPSASNRHLLLCALMLYCCLVAVLKVGNNSYNVCVCLACLLQLKLF